MLLFIIFIFGLCVGSFLNVIICRLKTGEDIIKKRSHCPKCRHELSWPELIPLVSFLALKGKCLKCKSEISWQYPLVEFFTGILFVYGYVAASYQLLATSYLFIIVSLFIIIFVYDLKHYEIPNEIVYSGIVISLIYSLYFNFSEIKFFILGALIPAAFFLGLIILSRGEWMGMGDVKLAFFLGIFLGLQKVLLAILLAFWSGAIIGIILMILKKKKLKSQIPFGPFLIGGALISLFFYQEIIDFYWRLI